MYYKGAFYEKKVLSILLIFSIILGFLDFNPSLIANAKNNISEYQPDSDINMSVKGTNSIGNLISKEIESETEIIEDGSEEAFSIVDVEMNGSKASVEYSVTDICTLIVSIYDNDGIAMLASGYVEINPEETDEDTVDVTIDIDVMPEYYYVRANLVDSVTYAPLAEEYESSLYTQEMQEFLAKDIYDFDQDRVVNFDDSVDTNFAVFAEGTIIVSEAETRSTISVDEDNNIYIIENANDDTKNLQQGDIYAYEKSDGELVIIKVASIVIDGDTVTIYGDETDLEEVFEHFRIDEEMDTSDVEIDETGKDESVTIDLIEDELSGKTFDEFDPNKSILLASNDMPGNGYDSVIKRGISITETAPFTIKATIADYKFNPESEDSVTLGAEVNIKITASVKLYVSFSKKYFDFKICDSIGFSGEVSGKTDLVKIPIGIFGFNVCPGVIVELNFNVVFEFSGKLSFEANMTDHEIGFNIEKRIFKKSKTQSHYKKAKFEVKLEGEASFFVGVSFEPRVKVISDKIANADLEVMVGYENKLKKTTTKIDTGETKHDCENCLSIESYFKISSKASVQLLNLNSLKFELKIADIKLKPEYYYYSFDHNEFGKEKCPYKSTKIKFYVCDENGKPINYATIEEKITGKTISTDNNGNAADYFLQGKRSFLITYLDYSKTIKKDVKDVGFTIKVKFGDNKNTHSSGGGIHDGNSTIIDVNDSIPIDEAHFPDENFRNYLEKNYDNDSDGYLTYEERTSNNYMYCNRKNISSLKGIEYFPELIILSCYENNLSELNLSNNKKIVRLNCRANNISNLIISNNLELKYLDCSVNDILQLDLSKNLELIDLDCGANDISKLDLSKLSNLQTCDCRVCTLDSLILPKKSSLTSLECDNNNLSSIDFSNSVCLETLDCDNNNLVELDLSNKNNLKRIECRYNKLTSLDLSDDSELLYLYCDNNKLTDIQFYNCSKLYYIHCSFNEFTSMNLTDCKQLTYLSCYNNKLNSINITDCKQLYSIDCRNNKLTSLNISNNKDLEELFCDNNSISEIDVSNNNKLRKVTCDDGVNIIGYTLGSAGMNNNTLPEIEPLEKNYLGTSLGDINNNQNTMPSETKTETFTGLNPNDRYLFYVMSDREADEPFSVSNLLYIKQAESDENGSITIDYIPIIEDDYADIFVVWSGKFDISESEVDLDDLTYIGEEQYVEPVVKYNGYELKEGIDYYLQGDFCATDIGDYSVDIVGTGFYKGSKSTDYRVNELTPISEIKMSYNQITLEVNSTINLSVEISPSNATDTSVTWSSSNTSVATVDMNGKVTAKSEGTATITATANDGSGKQAICTVTVNKDDTTNDDITNNDNKIYVTGITLDANKYELSIGETKTLKPTINPSNATDRSVSWSSSNSSVATVDNSGNITAKTTGTTTITVKTNDGSGKSTTCTIIVKNNVTYVQMHRLYNPNSGEHFYTANVVERDKLVGVGWRYEGVAWNAPTTSDTPVYRLYNPNAGDHHYTTSVAEKNNLVKVGWKYEGIGWYSTGTEGQALYRLYNPNAKAAGSHHYTTNASEKDNLVKLGWRYEGIAWYGGK